MKEDRYTGLYDKYQVKRTDGSSDEGKKHELCDHFVLDLVHDKHARTAILAYADSCEADYPHLARDLRLRAQRMIGGPMGLPQAVKESER